ncbi:MAG TPA: D-2-hydroxyacid dehydrogenase family protein [Vicinamibacterales bacterium]|nr:D-2-hydroxyacid dehydrogenase family protein [Vicinamibacterales bacterium]
MPKPVCAILDDYQGVSRAMADWSAVERHAELRVFREAFAGEDALVAAVGDCEIVVAMRERTPFRAATFERLPRLRLLVTTGMRNAAIDLEAARARGVTVCGTASLGEPPAEITWALLLALAKHVVPESAAFRTNGPWQSTLGADLNGRQLGLLGLGKIGSRMAAVGLAFGMEVVAWSQNLTSEGAAAAGARLAPSKASLLETSDFVSIHLVLSERTRGLLGRDDLRRMKPTAYLINTSRGPIVDEAALVEALTARWIAGAGLDVFDVEPPRPDSPFRSLPNVLATPHLGYVTESNYRVYYGEAAEDVAAFLEGTPIRVVN